MAEVRIELVRQEDGLTLHFVEAAPGSSAAFSAWVDANATDLLNFYGPGTHTIEEDI